MKGEAAILPLRVWLRCLIPRFDGAIRSQHYHKNARYHEILHNVVPASVYFGLEKPFHKKRKRSDERRSKRAAHNTASALRHQPNQTRQTLSEIKRLLASQSLTTGS